MKIRHTIENEITWEQLKAAEDPDGLIGAEITKLVAAAHI